MATTRFPTYLTLLSGTASRSAAERAPVALGLRPTPSSGQRDPLTGVATRQSLLEQVEIIGQLAPAAPLSFVVVRLDGLESLNRLGGWRAGDEALRTVARAIQELSRATDMVGRLSGSSFGVILQGTGATAAGAVAERLAHHIQRLPTVARPVEAAVSVATGTGINADTLPVAAIDSLLNCG
jgi:diguanylate cyclase (GGDEF)-like protein